MIETFKFRFDYIDREISTSSICFTLYAWTKHPRTWVISKTSVKSIFGCFQTMIWVALIHWSECKNLFVSFWFILVTYLVCFRLSKSSMLRKVWIFAVTCRNRTSNEFGIIVIRRVFFCCLMNWIQIWNWTLASGDISFQVATFRCFAQYVIMFLTCYLWKWSHLNNFWSRVRILMKTSGYSTLKGEKGVYLARSHSMLPPSELEAVNGVTVGVDRQFSLHFKCHFIIRSWRNSYTNWDRYRSYKHAFAHASNAIYTIANIKSPCIQYIYSCMHTHIYGNGAGMGKWRSYI